MREVRLEEDSPLSAEQVKRLETTLQIYPPENVLDFYERRLASCDHSSLNKKDQDCALAILKILQCLN